MGADGGQIKGDREGPGLSEVCRRASVVVGEMETARVAGGKLRQEAEFPSQER